MRLDDKGEKCVFLGISETSKAYKLFNPLTKNIIINIDVIFDKESTWNWDGQQPSIPTSFKGEEVLQPLHQQISIVTVEAPTTTNVSQTTSRDAATDSCSYSVRKRLAWMVDYEIIGINQTKDLATHFALSMDYDPITFESAGKESKWRKVMDDEIEAIGKKKNT